MSEEASDTRWSRCVHCGGEIVGPAQPTAPLPEIWLHKSSGGTACHRIGFEQTYPGHSAAPEGLDDL